MLHFNNRPSFIFLTLLSVVLCNSCGGKKGETGTIRVSVQPQKAIVVSGSARSCLDVLSGDPTARSISGPRIQYQKVTITWDEPKDELFLVALKLRVNTSTIGNVRQEITSDELDAFFDIDQNQFTGYIGTKKTKESATYCSLGFGGLPISDDTPSFTATGTIRIVGYAVKENGEQYPASGEAQVSFEYQQDF